MLLTSIYIPVKNFPCWSTTSLSRASVKLATSFQSMLLSGNCSNLKIITITDLSFHNVPLWNIIHAIATWNLLFLGVHSYRNTTKTCLSSLFEVKYVWQYVIFVAMVYAKLYMAKERTLATRLVHSLKLALKYFSEWFKNL